MKRLLICLSLLASPAWSVENPLQPSPAWDDMRSSVTGSDAEPLIDPAILDLDAPVRADNPALVPVHITQPKDAPAIKDVALVIDNNPAPVAGTFTFGPSTAPLDFEVRVRVDAYADIRAVATLADGRKVMGGRFVKASGGCAAPAGKTPEESRKGIGEMRWKSVPTDDRATGTLMIRHPNFSGLQRDQVTLLTIPAEFIQTLEVKQGDELLFSMDGGISVSENPVFVFAYRPNGQPITVHAQDTENRIFDKTFPANP